VLFTPTLLSPAGQSFFVPFPDGFKLAALAWCATQQITGHGKGTTARHVHEDFMTS